MAICRIHNFNVLFQRRTCGLNQMWLMIIVDVMGEASDKLLLSIQRPADALLPTVVDTGSENKDDDGGWWTRYYWFDSISGHHSQSTMLPSSTPRVDENVFVISERSVECQRWCRLPRFRTAKRHGHIDSCWACRAALVRLCLIISANCFSKWSGSGKEGECQTNGM